VLNVLLVGETDRRLEELLKASGAHVAPLSVTDLASPGQRSAKRADVVVVDLRGSARVPPAIASFKRLHPDVGVVVVASALDPALLLEAMRSGVNELVADPVTQADLDKAISRVVGQKPLSELGQAFGIVGAKGGTGTTTVAVNLATALGAMSKPRRALLVDLHQAGGDAAVFLGAEPRFSIADAFENTHRLDESFFRTLVIATTPGLDLLAAPERAGGGQLEPGKIRALIQFVTTIYKYVVIDLPRSDGSVLDALDQLGAVVVVVNQELATVKGASRLATALRQRYGRDKVKIVVSRSDRQADIGHADMERAIGSQIVHTFPSDYRLALHALNKGRPIALDNHNDLSASFNRFASQLAGIKPEREPAPRAGLLGRLTQRRP
jgi:pilus assembly protein CpaE